MDLNVELEQKYSKVVDRIKARNKALATTHKKCNGCDMVLVRTSFGKWARGTNGLKSTCKDCTKLYESSDDAKAKAKARMERYKKTDKYKVNQRDYQHRRREKKLSTMDGSIPETRRDMTQELLDLMVQQENKCVLCFKNITIETSHLDHIKPLSKGGTHTLENVQWLCPACNCSKGAKIV